MVCNACGRKVDPARSFCRTCGGAVFIDEAELRSPHMHRLAPTARPIGLQPTEQQPTEQPTEQRPAVRARRSIEVRRSARTSTPPRSTGCLLALVRLLIFAAIVWYVGRWLFAIPEVRAVVDALASGSVSDEQLKAAVTAIRDHVFQ